MLGAQTISISGRCIGPDHPPYIVAEMSGNHNGDIERAFRILDAAKTAGGCCQSNANLSPVRLAVNG